MGHFYRPLRRRRGFTLVELLLSMSILAILMMIVSGVISETQKTWKYTSGRTTQFREARFAFDLITRNLSQATLNTYWDYDQGGVNDPDKIPTRYVRQSELHFISGFAKDLVTGTGSGSGDSARLPYHAVFFQAPLGVTEVPTHSQFQNLLAGRGYFVQFGDDAGIRPPFVTQSRFRYRLMEYSPTTERNMIYYNYKNGSAPNDWFSDAGRPMSRSAESGSGSGGTTLGTRGFTRPVAENIIALILAPKVSSASASAIGEDSHWIARDFRYDSRQPAPGTVSSIRPQGTQHLLPPLIDVVMVALDEVSASALALKHGSSPVNWASYAPFSIASDSRLRDDLATLERELGDEKLNYRVFKTTVELRGSRWSL